MLALVARGTWNRAIAAELFISEAKAYSRGIWAEGPQPANDDQAASHSAGVPAGSQPTCA